MLHSVCELLILLIVRIPEELCAFQNGRPKIEYNSKYIFYILDSVQEKVHKSFLVKIGIQCYCFTGVSSQFYGYVALLYCHYNAASSKEIRCQFPNTQVFLYKICLYSTPHPLVVNWAGIGATYYTENPFFSPSGLSMKQTTCQKIFCFSQFGKI